MARINIIINFMKCRKGATVIEYVIIASGVALGIVAALYAFGGDLGIIFGSLTETTNNS